jgi:hypothetical protein
MYLKGVNHQVTQRSASHVLYPVQSAQRPGVKAPKHSPKTMSGALKSVKAMESSKTNNHKLQ